MALTAEAMADRVDNPGLWSGETHLEGLVGRCTRPASLGGAPTVEYRRRSGAAAQRKSDTPLMFSASRRVSPWKKAVLRVPPRTKRCSSRTWQFTKN